MKLAEVCRIVGGGTPSKKNKAYYSGNIPWASVRDMNNPILTSTEFRISDEAVRESATNVIPAGEVIISTHVGLGKVCILAQDTAINQDLKAVIPTVDIDRRYLYHWFVSQAPKLVAAGKGATVKGVTVKFVLDLDIPIPSRNSQQSIAKQLSLVLECVKKRQAQLARLDALAKSLFVEMFGDPVENPRGWRIARLGEFVLFQTSGSRGWAKYYSEDGEIFITIKNVKNTRINLSEVQHVQPPKGAETERTRVREGDLLISITADLGRTGVVTKEVADAGAYVNQHLVCIRLKQKDIDPVYVAHYLESPAGKTQFRQKNQNAVKAGLNFNSIQSLAIALPPIVAQREFRSNIEAIDKSKFAILRWLSCFDREAATKSARRGLSPAPWRDRD